MIMLNSDCFSTLLKCSHTCSCLKRKMKKTESERWMVGERKDRDVSAAVAVLLKCTIVQNTSYIRPRCDTRPESKCTAWQSCDSILTFCAQNPNCFTANLLLRNCKSSKGFFCFFFLELVQLLSRERDGRRRRLIDCNSCQSVVC